MSTPPISETPQILFVQGGGAGVHDEWDDKLVADLRRGVGDGHEVRYPRMPVEEDPSDATWGAAIRREMADLNAGAVVVGHSVGGTIIDPNHRRAAAGAGARCDRADRRSVRR